MARKPNEETIETIQMCLTCDKPECTNCMGQVKEIRRREQMRRYNANFTPEQAERQREAKRRYHQSERGKIKDKEHNRKYYQAHKEEIIARVLQRRAVQHG